jgi:hypothetical protein
LSQSGTGKEHGAGGDHKASTHLGGVWMVRFCKSCREQRVFFPVKKGITLTSAAVVGGLADGCFE